MSQLPSGPKNLSDVGSAQSIIILPGFSLSISVFLPAETDRPSLRSAAASLRRCSPQSHHTNTEEWVRVGKQTATGVSRWRMSASDAQGSDSRVGRCLLDLRRERCCCNLTAPPRCHPANQSQPRGGAEPHSYWTTVLSVTEASVSSLNTEIT